MTKKLIKFFAFFIVGAMAPVMSLQAQPQKIIDSWGMTTGVDTTLWYDLDGVDSVLIDGGNKVAGRSGLVNIGFPFTLGVSTYSQFSTNINGTVRLGSTQLSTSGNYSNALNQNNGPKIEPFGYRGRFDSTCYTRKALLGPTGHRVLVVETRMKDYNNYNDSLYMSFQVQLFEDGDLRIVYGDADAGAVYATTSAVLQNGVSASANNNDKDIIFIDFATHEAVRFDASCSRHNAAATWPEKGRWYNLFYDNTICPYPSAVTVSATDPSNVSLQSSYDGVLHVVIPALGVDTLWLGGSLNLGSLNPATSYHGTLQTVCGSDTSFRTRAFSFATGCGPVIHLPWISEFANYDLNCWDASRYTYTAYRWEGSNGYAAGGGYANNHQYDEWLVSPVLNLPDADGLVLKYKYWAENDLENRSNTVDVRVAPCTAAGVVDSADWTTVMTMNGAYSSNTEWRIFLDSWRGQTVKVAFVLTGVGGNGAYLDRTELTQELEPVVTLTAPTHARTGESVTLTAHFVTGTTTGLTYTWHSSLLDTTIVTLYTLTLTYPTAGTDTVTLVVSNTYGSDTLTAVYQVVDCPAVTLLPWTETFTGGSMCWYLPAGSNWSVGKPNSYSTIRALHSPYTNDALDRWVISPAIQMPADTNDVMILEWNEAATMSSVTHQPNYSVLVSTDPDFLDLTTYDTLLTVSSGVVSSGTAWTNWGARSANLTAYAGETIHLAFCRHPSFYGNTYTTDRLLIDNVTVRSAAAPVVTLAAPTQVETYSNVTFTATLAEGLPCSYSWHSALMDSTFNGANWFTLAYTVGGTDTVKVVATNAYGSDSATAVVHVVDCSPVDLPWTEDFDALAGTAYNAQGPMPDCWRSYWNGSNTALGPHVINAYPYNPLNSYFANNQQALMLLAGTPGQYSIDGIDSVAIVESPTFAVPLNQKRLSFYYQQEGATRGVLSVGYMQDSTFVSVADLPQQQTGSTVTMSLGAFPSDVYRLAFRWSQNVSWYGVIIDNIVLKDFDSVPTVAMAAPQWVRGDSVLFRAYLTDGLADSLTYSWHSSMADAGHAILTSAGDSAYIEYTAAGTDTVKVVATNAFGSDSVSMSYPYANTPVGVFTGPSAVDTYDTATYAARLFVGSPRNLSFSWQSSMAAAGQAAMMPAGDTLRMVYFVGGTDTLTLVTTNAFGTDNTVVTVTVNYVPMPGSPVVNLQGHNRATMCDTATFVATLVEGDTAGLAYTWHSAKASRGDAVMVPQGARLKISYSSPQTDTVTVTASNIHGWRSASVTTFVIACEVRDSLPYLAPLTSNGSGLYDWQPSRLCGSRGNIYSSSQPSSWWNVTTVGTPAHPCVKSTRYTYDHTTANAWLVSPPIQLPDSLPDTLSWNDYCFHSTYHVLLSPSEYVVLPDGSIDTTYFTDTLYTGSGATWWHRRTVDISAYAGRTIHIAFVHSGPSTDPDRYGVAVAIDSMRVWAGTDRDTLAGPCPPVADYPWSEDFEILNIGITNPCCWELMHSELSTAGYNYWYRAGSDNGYYMRTNQPFRGETASDWLITPPLALPAVTAAGAPKLSWRMFANHANEVYEVRISPTASADSADFTELIFTETGPFDWSDRNLWLAQYAGQTVRIAFRNISTGRMGGGFDYMGIDDISVSVDSTYSGPVWRTVAVTANVPAAVAQTYGSGSYPDGSTVEIGYHLLDTLPVGGHWHFLGWNDGLTGNPRNIVVASDTAIVALFQWVSDSTEGIGEIENSKLKIEIYPNPAHDEVTVETGQPSTLTLTDATGRECGRWKVTVGKNTLHIGNLPVGVYFLQLSTSPTIRKLIIR